MSDDPLSAIATAVGRTLGTIELIDENLLSVFPGIMVTAVVGSISGSLECDELGKIGVRQQEVDEVIKLIILSATLATLTPTPHGFTIACLVGSAAISGCLHAVPQC